MTDWVGPNGEEFSTGSIRINFTRAVQEAANRTITHNEQEALHGTTVWVPEGHIFFTCPAPKA